MVTYKYLMETNFSDWLSNEIKKRNLTQAELAKMSGITAAQISRIINGQRGAGEETLLAIARALRMPPETVFRIAGLLPPVPQNTEQTDELLYLFAQLPDNQKPIAVDYIRFLVEKNEAKNNRR